MLRLLASLGLALVCQLSAAQPPNAQLAVGDWVLRQGTSVESLLIANFGKGEYSHIGIVVQTKPQIKILHATTDDKPQTPNQIILSDWAEFTNPELARSYAVARAQFLSREQQQQISNSLLKLLGEPFILAARDKPHQYCTTILADAISAVQPDFSVQWSFLDQPLVRGYYLHPDAFTNQRISWVIPRQTTLVSASHTKPLPAPESHKPVQ